MSLIKKVITNRFAQAETRDMDRFKDLSGNTYQSLVVASKRANQVSGKIREELHEKLKEFAALTDNLEEVLENREQIEISRLYERMPHPTLQALNEFLEEGTYFRNPDEESAEK